MSSNHDIYRSEIDLSYGIFFKRYVECKNYGSKSVGLEDVAKFKEVLRLHSIPPRRGLFITTSTYSPRAHHVGVPLIDGKRLDRWEKQARVIQLMRWFVRGSIAIAVALFCLPAVLDEPRVAPHIGLTDDQQYDIRADMDQLASLLDQHVVEKGRAKSKLQARREGREEGAGAGAGGGWSVLRFFRRGSDNTGSHGEHNSTTDRTSHPFAYTYNNQEGATQDAVTRSIEAYAPKAYKRTLCYVYEVAALECASSPFMLQYTAYRMKIGADIAHCTYHNTRETMGSLGERV